MAVSVLRWCNLTDNSSQKSYAANVFTCNDVNLSLCYLIAITCQLCSFVGFSWCAMDLSILLVHSKQSYEVQTGDLDFASTTGDYCGYFLLKIRLYYYVIGYLATWFDGAVKMFTIVAVDVAFSSYFVEKVLHSLWLKCIVTMPLWWILQVRRLHLKVQNVLKRFVFCVQVTVVIRRVSMSGVDVSHELVLCHRSHHHCGCNL